MTPERAREIFANELRKENNIYATVLADAIKSGENNLYVVRAATNAIVEACREAAIDLCEREI